MTVAAAADVGRAVRAARVIPVGVMGLVVGRLRDVKRAMREMMGLLQAMIHHVMMRRGPWPSRSVPGRGSRWGKIRFNRARARTAAACRLRRIRRRAWMTRRRMTHRAARVMIRKGQAAVNRAPGAAEVADAGAGAVAIAQAARRARAMQDRVSPRAIKVVKAAKAVIQPMAMVRATMAAATPSGVDVAGVVVAAGDEAASRGAKAAMTGLLSNFADGG